MNDAELKAELMARRAILVAEQNAIGERVLGIDTALKSLFQSGNMQLPLATATPHPAVNGESKWTAAEAIQAAIDSSPKHFSILDVLQFLHKHQPSLVKNRKYAGNVFWIICKNKGYAVVRRGAGRAPTVYSKESE